jgi:hypothetical protein
MPRRLEALALAGLLSAAGAWPLAAGAVEFNYTVTASPTEPTAGGTLTLSYVLNDAIDFNVLDARIDWDAALLSPGSNFFQIGGLLSGFSATPSVTPGSVIISVLPDVIYQTAGPGVLFQLNFDVLPGIAVPTATSIDFVSSVSPEIPTGMVLTYLDDLNGDDIAYTRPATAPDGISVTIQAQPTPAPEPGSAILALAGLSAMATRRRRPTASARAA